MSNETITSTVAPAAPQSLHHAVPMPFTQRDEFELALRQAKVYAASTLVPKDYQDNLPNCLIAANMAKRIGADVLQVMQNMDVIHGRPSWRAQFLIASFNQCGRFSAMRFETKGHIDGKESGAGMRAYATEKATGEKIHGPWITWQLVKAEGWDAKNGSKWKTMHELMFMYRAAAFLVRTHAPEIAMGLQTAEEIADVIDVTPTSSAEHSEAGAVEKARAAVRKALDGDAVKVVEPAGDAPTFAAVMEQINAANTPDEFDMIADLLRSVPDEKQRAELDVELRAARKRYADKDIPQ